MPTMYILLHDLLLLCCGMMQTLLVPKHGKMNKTVSVTIFSNITLFHPPVDVNHEIRTVCVT